MSLPQRSDNPKKQAAKQLGKNMSAKRSGNDSQFGSGDVLLTEFSSLCGLPLMMISHCYWLALHKHPEISHVLLPLTSSIIPSLTTAYGGTRQVCCTLHLSLCARSQYSSGEITAWAPASVSQPSTSQLRTHSIHLGY